MTCSAESINKLISVPSEKNENKRYLEEFDSMRSIYVYPSKNPPSKQCKTIFEFVFSEVPSVPPPLMERGLLLAVFEAHVFPLLAMHQHFHCYFE